MKVRRIDFYPDDWLAGTRGLSFAEAGAYWGICAVIYSKGGPVHRTVARKILGGKNFDKLLARLLTLGKVTDVASMLSVCRCDEELTRSLNRLASAHQAADKRWKENETAHANGADGAHAPRAPARPSTINNQQSSLKGYKNGFEKIGDVINDVSKPPKPRTPAPTLQELQRRGSKGTE